MMINRQRRRLPQSEEKATDLPSLSLPVCRSLISFLHDVIIVFCTTAHDADVSMLSFWSGSGNERYNDSQPQKKRPSGQDTAPSDAVANAQAMEIKLQSTAAELDEARQRIAQLEEMVLTLRMSARMSTASMDGLHDVQESDHDL
jgi:hypothetical protein